ncbi:MAG: glycosyltransferase family 87 protein [Elusimicrobia bacterium]|nr:glycosyltransferase family 87 protein [Elusimicrobiota bacterium]
MRRLRDFRLLSALESAPWELRLLVLLAVFEYASKGLFLGLFTNSFDFASFHNAAALAAHGEGAHVYDTFFSYVPGSSPVPMFFLYPAPVALLVAPLGLFTFQTASVLFSALGHACLWGALALWSRGRPDEERLTGFLLVFLFFPAWYSLQVGQAEPFVLLALLAVPALQESGRSSWAGLCLALAICLKLFLLFLLVYLVLRRSWRLLAWTAIWLGALFGAGGFVVPWDIQARYWGRVGSSLGFEAFTDNQSITGFAHRAFTNTHFAQGLIDSARAARVAKIELAGLVMAAYAWLVGLKSRETALFGRDYGFTVVTLLLIAPIVDTHHHALLLIPFLGLLASGPRGAVPLAFYAFFARWEPLVAFKFLSQERLAFWSAAPASLVYSIPFFMMAGLWLYTARTILLSADGSRRP